MIKAFLENKKYSYSIAQVAVVFQSVLTILLVVSLLFSLSSVEAPLRIITWLLILDTTFVVLHLSYRGAYRGPKVALAKDQKTMLLVHVTSSLVALCSTVYLVAKKIQEQPGIIWIILVVWVISLISGLLFFRKKYIVL